MLGVFFSLIVFQTEKSQVNNCTKQLSVILLVSQNQLYDAFVVSGGVNEVSQAILEKYPPKDAPTEYTHKGQRPVFSGKPNALHVPNEEVFR